VLAIFYGIDQGCTNFKTLHGGDWYPGVKVNSVALVRERTMPTERPPLVGEVVPNFADGGCRVVSATDSHGR
jgi:hypothetical protein